jgi:hypothetical protein
MHHGHADEGSIALLVHDGTVLLHESGYREAPPDGMYRADVYHNRLIWRPGTLDPSALPAALMDRGHYVPARTERLYHTRLGEADIARVRITDDAQGVTWDRSVFFLADLPCWVVVDAARALADAEHTFALLWWTTDVLGCGADWADTHIGAIQDWQNARNAALRIITPDIAEQPTLQASATFRRAFQNEVLLASTCRSTAGRTINFVTVLWPHPHEPRQEDEGLQVEVIPSEPAGRGIGVRLKWRGETRLLATLNDLAAGVTTEDVRPRYNFERGKAVYGPLLTDGAFAYVRETADPWAGFINGTRLDYAGKTLYAGLPHAMFQEDRTDRPGVPARFRWESNRR